MGRILIVEDEPLIAMMLHDWLTEMGHHPVGPVASVNDALKVAGDATIDAAILDVNLGGQQCDPVADLLMARGVPFAFTTGASGDRIDKRFAGRPTVTKPYDFAAMQRLIDRLVHLDPS